jgi:hypothetical protein
MQRLSLGMPAIDAAAQSAAHPAMTGIDPSAYWRKLHGVKFVVEGGLSAATRLLLSNFVSRPDSA